MKKLFTVLAVLLVASVAFAGFSGSVKAQYKFDFDAKTIAYSKPNMGAVDVNFNWDSQTYTVGDLEGTHIDFALAAGFEGFYNLSSDHAKNYDPFRKASAWNWSYKWVDEGRKTNVKAGVTLKVATFKIVAENFEINFLGDLALDFAKSAIDTEKFNGDTLEENVQAYTLNNSLKGKHNLTVTAYGYKFGFGLGTTKTWEDDFTFALTAVTPEYDFNGAKATFGAAYQVSENVWQVAASAKASYAADKWSVGGAYDMVKVANKDFINNEIAVNFGFAPVAVDVYFNNEGAKATDKYKDYIDELGHEILLDSNYLSAKVVVDVAKVAENVPVTVTLTGANLINEEEQDLSVAAETTVVPNFKFGAYFKDWFDQVSNHRKLGATVEFTGVQNLTLNAEVAYAFAKDDGDKKFFGLVGAKYAHELFTASAEVGMEKVYDQDAKFGADASVKSTKLVNGAELSAKAVFNLNGLEDTIDPGTGNTLTFACKVSF
jgi:hypothetical protein